MMRQAGVTLYATLLSIAFAGFANAQSKLAVHGYLSQAYAVTDGYQLFGIPEDGTTDYRNLALQFLYAVDPKDAIVIQFSHKRLGLSAVMDLEDEVKLDWAFARHDLSQTTSIKFGKVQLPLGIYNELRDVGTLLPFYRASWSVYGEGSWTSETIDGIVFSSTINKNSPWNLDVDLFYGGWDTIESNNVDPMAIARNENGIGAQLWLNTGVDGLRIGLEGHRYTTSAGILRTAGKKDNSSSWIASLDATFEYAIVQAEYLSVQVPPSKFKAYYVHLGYKFSERFSAHVQGDFGKVNLNIQEQFFSLKLERELLDDYAVGVRYFFSNALALKAEMHWTEGYTIEDGPPDFFFGPPVKTKYAIISLSGSF